MTDAARGARIVATMLACLVTAPACLSKTQVRYYTLESAAAAEVPPAGSRYTIRVAPAIVPEALDRPELVLRVSATEVAIDDNHRWAESLRTAISRAVAVRLSRDLTGARVSAAKPSPAQPSDVELRIDVQSLEVSLTAGAVVDVVWTARWTNNGETRTGRSIGRAAAGPGGGRDAAVAACAAALNTVAGDIAGAVRREYMSSR